MPKFLFLNGPPKSGKDTIVKELVQYTKFQHIKFSMPMKRAIAGLLDIREADVETYKDVTSPVLQRVGTTQKEYRDTLRELLIAFSEDFLKVKYGNDIFGRIFWQHAKQSAFQLIISSDCGFEEEVERVISNAGAHHCRLVRLHRDGTDFDGDSRSYLRDGLCSTWDITNDGTVHEVTMKVLRMLTQEFSVPLLKEPDWIK